MYVKKNFMLWLAVFAMALPLLFVGTASARYMNDGAVSDPTGTAGQIAPTDGICVLSIDINGNMVTDATIKTKRDCDARLVSVTANLSGDTLANVCGNTTKNNAGLKYAAPGSNTCVTIDGSGFINGSKSMVNLDRGAVMCNGLGGQLASAVSSTVPLSNGAVITTSTKTVANGTAATCIAFGWQYRNQDVNGNPLPFGVKGTSQTDMGYCYASMRMATATTKNGAAIDYSTAAGCPASRATTAPYNANAAYDWAATNCTYAKGNAGILNAALTKIDGTANGAAGTFKDLSVYTTMGECLANGGAWANWFGKPGSFDLYSMPSPTPGTAALPAWDYTRQAPDADNGCLHCHSYKSQQNGPAERFKDSYLKTGHKNMLRKVTAGQKMIGPDGVVYTQDTLGHAIDFTAGTVGGGPLYYIFGDWMAALPNAVGPNGDTVLYGCGACHTSGFRDNTNPGVLSLGTPSTNPGYVPVQPADAGAGYVAAVTPGHKWDLEGIQCSRCHNAAVGPVSQTMISASTFSTTAPVGGGMGALAAGVGRNNLCFGCHQSIAKNWPAQGGAVTGTTQYDPTLIPTGVSHGAAAGRDFNGHVLGNSFLNSVHAKYNGVNSNSAIGGIKLNSLGKYDLFDSQPTNTNVALEYGSIFKGFSCFQSTSSSSPGKTKADGTEIKTKADCEALYGAGAWRNDTGSSTAGRVSYQGTCTTCHDIHNSLFVPEQQEASIRKTCADCHVNNATTGATAAASPQVASTNHPAGAGTPFDTTKYESGCAACHMAIQAVENGNQNSMPVHVWRINTNASYNTFPTTTQFYGGTCSVQTGTVQNAPYLPVVYASETSALTCTTASGTWIDTSSLKDRNAQTAPDGSYTKAVWVDLDLACGQCHGGSFGASKTANNAPYFTKSYLSGMATGMHANTPSPSKTVKFGMQTSQTTNYNVRFDASASICPSGACVSTDFVWNFGDGTTPLNSGPIVTHTYTDGTTRTVTLTIGTDSKSKTVTPVYVASTPTSLSGVNPTSTGFTATMNFVVSGGTPTYKVRVNWGDGTVGVDKNFAGGTSSMIHTYATATTYKAFVYAIDSGVLGSNMTSTTTYVNVPIAASTSTVAGLVTTSTGAPISGAAVTLTKLNGVVKYLAYTNASGAYLFSGVMDNTYTLKAAKSGVTFPAPISITTSGVYSAPTISAITP